MTTETPVIRKTLRMEKPAEYGTTRTTRLVHLIVDEELKSYRVTEWVIAQLPDYTWCVGHVEDVIVHKFDTLADAKQAFSRLSFAEKI